MTREALHVSLVLLASLALGCAGRYTPRRPKPIVVSRQDAGAPFSTCVPSAARTTPSADTPAATATGDLSLIDTRGDDRLMLPDRFALTWSGDSETLYTATESHVAFWSRQSGKLQQGIPLKEPFDSIRSIVLSPDGHQLALSGSRREKGKSFDTPGVILIRLPDGEQRLVPNMGGDIRFTPDSKELFGGGQHWNIATSSRRRDKAIGVNRQDLPDGRRFITFIKQSEKNNSPYIPELRESPGDVLLHRFDPVLFSGAVHISGDGRRIALLDKDLLRIYSADTYEQLTAIDTPHRAQMVALSHDGRRAAVETLMCVQLLSTHTPAKSTCPEPMMSVWDLDSNKELWRSPAGSGDRWIFTRDGSLLTGPNTRLVDSLRRVETGEVLQFGSRIRSISPDGRWILYWGDSGLHWAAPGGDELPYQRNFRPLLRALSPDGTYRVTAASGQLRLEGNGSCLTLGGAGFASQRLAFSADGALLLAVGRDREGTIAHAIESNTGKQRWTLRFGGEGGQQARVFIAGDRLLVQGTDHDEVLQFDLQSGAQQPSGKVPRLSYHSPTRNGLTHEVRDTGGDRVSHLAFPSLSLDGRRVATMETFESRYWVSVWDLASPKDVIDHPAGGWVSQIVPSPKGTSWAIGYRNGRIRLLTQDGSRWIEPAQSHKAAVTSLQFTPSGHRLISSAKDGTILAIDPATGAVGGRADLPFDYATHLAISPSEDAIFAETARRMQIRLQLTPSP